ncbi:hypothetical protein CAPTEDRAFT_159353 [Capitella teleta]|uniref:Thioredoxin domain-containing protein n=1 Tax=Capitella teleta TaxID=283909 RepID=R7UID4_CAPTE|nr:hypothetical protein CAPTEDRAFT_159353 [Capitella teleta]|eukprot:ELU05863.1 hypothetical protein CAPTEDRAFT_159353 [Capitella teleta]
MLPSASIAVFSVALCVCLVRSQVIELDDSFEDKRQDKPWLVMFYAPWCGHCRRLHPTFHQVYLDLRDTPVRVAKVDATLYPNLASQYDVRGYPTIKFIQGEKSFTHRGERSKESLAEFAKMAAGPRIRKISNKGKLADARGDHSSRTFFVFVGDESHDLYAKYTQLTEDYPVHSYYYVAESKAIPSDIKMLRDPSVLVFKDGTQFEFKDRCLLHVDLTADIHQGDTKEELENFIKAERFVSFPKVADGGLNEMADTPKKMAIVVTDESSKENKEQERIKDLVRLLIVQEREKYHDRVQFLWMGDAETASSILMGGVKTPMIFVLDTSTQMHYLMDTPAENLTIASLSAFLDDVLAGNVEVFGGTGFGQRVKRLFFDIYYTVYSIWKESPWLALMVFGIPSLVVSIVCYALCCMEPFDEEQLGGDEDEEEEEGGGRVEAAVEETDGHIKKE